MVIRLFWSNFQALGPGKKERHYDAWSHRKRVLLQMELCKPRGPIIFDVIRFTPKSRPTQYRESQFCVLKGYSTLKKPGKCSVLVCNAEEANHSAKGHQAIFITLAVGVSVRE
jgi:hypothetical protein